MQIDPEDDLKNSEKDSFLEKNSDPKEKYKSSFWTVLPGIGLIVIATFISQQVYFPSSSKCKNTALLRKSEENIITNESIRKLRNTGYNSEKIEARFNRRMEYYNSECEKFIEFDHKGMAKSVINNGVGNHTSWMIYSRKNDFLLCAPPKTGTSNWQRSLVALEYNDYYKNTSFADQPMTIDKIAHEISPQTLFTLLSRLIEKDNRGKTNRKSLKSDENINDILTARDITRIMHVRHPFLRLHSAWTDKFSKNFNFDHDIRITKMFRHYDYVIWTFEDNDRYPRDPDARVSFYAFLKYISKGMGFVRNTRNGFNGHWARYTEICWPCVVDYTYITRLETIDDDSRYLFDKAGFGEKIGYFPPAYNNSDSIDKVEKIFKSFPTSLVDKLYDLYYWDFKLFGYDKYNFTKCYLDE